MSVVRGMLQVHEELPGKAPRLCLRQPESAGGVPASMGPMLRSDGGPCCAPLWGTCYAPLWGPCCTPIGPPCCAQLGARAALWLGAGTHACMGPNQSEAVDAFPSCLRVQEFMASMEQAFARHPLWAGCSQEDLDAAVEVRSPLPQEARPLCLPAQPQLSLAF